VPGGARKLEELVKVPAADGTRARATRARGQGFVLTEVTMATTPVSTILEDSRGGSGRWVVGACAAGARQAANEGAQPGPA
jgi:hypothetical protein